MNADRVQGFLMAYTDDPQFQSFLGELGVSPDDLNIAKDETDLEAKEYGITLMFMDSGILAARHETGVPQLSDVQFSARGYDGGPPFQGQLPHGIQFTDNRDAIYARLGPPTARAMLGIPNERWESGDRYMTLDFTEDYSAIQRVTVGVAWNLVPP